MQWLLPPGIEDLLPPQAAALEAVRGRVLRVFDSWGYRLVEPPLLEYADALLTGVGVDLGAQTFKVTDPQSGALLGVRADITPQVARIDARHSGGGVARLCYLGSVLVAAPAYPGAIRNPVQVGAELYGHAGPHADVEVLRLMLATSAAIGEAGGDARLHVELGHVGIVRALAAGAGLSPDLEHTLFALLQRKARPDIAELLATAPCAADYRRWFAALPELYGDAQVLVQAQQCFVGAPQGVHVALEELCAIAREFQRFEPRASLGFDLAELRGYQYHTGAVFAAYQPGIGQAVARGGRYDGIGRVFGADRAATGFSVDLTRLILPAQDLPAAVHVPWDPDPGLAALVAGLRDAGQRVVYALPGEAGAGGDGEVTKTDGSWQVQAGAVDGK